MALPREAGRDHDLGALGRPKPDGTFQDAGMNSFNHYAYGAIGEWMYRVVAGLEIDPAEPGYKHVLVSAAAGRRPHLGRGAAEDALRRGGVGLGGGGRQGRPSRPRSRPTRAARSACPRRRSRG